MKKTSDNIEPPFVDRSSRYPGGGVGWGGGGIMLEKMPRFLTIESRVLQYLPLSRSPTTALQRYPFRVGRLSIRAQAP